MDENGSDSYAPGQSPATPAVVSSPPKDPNVRPHDMLKMMNPTPNGYSPVINHKSKPEGQEIVKHHESKNNIDHHKHSSDHVKKKDDDSKHKSSSHSKPKESSKEGKKEGHEGQKDKEKKHKEGSSHKESSKTKDGSHKHSDPSKSSSEKKEDKNKSDSIKEHHSSDGKPKTDNFKENEKIKDSSSKEHKEKHKEHKEKHKDKHKDKEHKEKHKDREHKEKHRDKEHKEKHKDKSSSSGEKPKEKSDKPKEKSDKPKDENAVKHKEHKEKHKDKHSDKHKDKHGEKHKEHKEKSKEKTKEEPVKAPSPVKELSSVKIKVKEEALSPVKHKVKEESLSPVKHKLKEDSVSDDDVPLSSRQASMDASKSIKREAMDSDDEPLSTRMDKKIKTEKTKKKKPTSDDEEYGVKEEKPKKKRKVEIDEEEYDTKKVKKVKKGTAAKKPIKQEPTATTSPKKKGKKEENEPEVWKWWEEEKLDDGIKWRTLEHCGPVFAPPYERVPKNVKFYYEGKHMELSQLTEEVAGFYGKMLDHDYTSKDVFNHNFFKDWRKIMTPHEKETIKDLKKCNFNNFNDYYKMKSEERKAMTKDQKLVIKKENEEMVKKYGFCDIDGHRQKIGNFRIEPPGLFRGRGEHPKMGMLKRRVEAEDVIINCGKGAKAPDPPPGHKWREVRHDNTVSWLASWNENILGSTKYVMLNPSSKLKGEKDWMKYETARKLKQHAGRIRDEYTRDFKSKEMKVRQRAVALYFIDKLALRAGNEKDEETADTVGCCSLRVEHITLDDEKDGQEYVVSFDFLGKDSIRYENSVPVEKRAYKNLKLFMENKQPGDDLFDRLNTAILNKYLNDLMEGLTAKVFRTYNASKTLQEQLDLLTKEDMSLPEKILAYNRANRAVAILCNHQRAVPKGFSKAMDNLKQKIDEKEQQIKEFKKELKQAKQSAKDGGVKDKQNLDKKKKRMTQLEEQLQKLEVQAMDKEENKQIALGTSKLNYLDPRISVAWCKKWSVPIEKIYNKTQRDKFLWAIEMVGPEYKF